MVLHIIGMILLGLIVGVIARLIVPGRQPMGWIGTALPRPSRLVPAPCERWTAVTA
jgi:hypothetical protein